jgi:UDP-N-acetylmuramoyl-L-alanyl-D-glutamate--2,6-diaminopimelate ligase
VDPQAPRARLQIEPDRRRAISSALSAAGPGDVVVIAGKGHETTQVIGDTVIDFDDRVEAQLVLGEMDAR